MVENWLRWHVGTGTDPKWKVVARRCRQPVHAVLAVWALMLECASQAADRGTLEGWDDEDAGAALDLTVEDVAAIREAMQGKVLDGGRLEAWSRRQPKREDNSADRVRAFRQRKRASPIVTDGDVTQGNASETQRNARGEERRVEEKREEQDPVFSLRSKTDAPRVSAEAEPAVASPIEPKAPETPQQAPSRPIGDVLWAEGLAYLKRAGVPEKQARSLLGRWRRDFGDGEALAAIAEADKAAATQPVEFVTAILQRRRQTRSRDAPSSTRYAI